MAVNSRAVAVNSGALTAEHWHLNQELNRERWQMGAALLMLAICGWEIATPYQVGAG